MAEQMKADYQVANAAYKEMKAANGDAEPEKIVGKKRPAAKSKTPTKKAKSAVRKAPAPPAVKPQVK